MRARNDNELLRKCAPAYAGLAAICCVLIVAAVTMQFGDALARCI